MQHNNSSEELSRRLFFRKLIKGGGGVFLGYLTFKFGFGSPLQGETAINKPKKSKDKIEEFNISGEENSVILPVKSNKKGFP